MPKRKIDANRIDELNELNSPSTKTIVDGDKSKDFQKVQGQEIAANRTKVYRDELDVVKSRKAAKCDKAWNALSEHLKRNEDSKLRSTAGADELIFEMAHLVKLFGDVLAQIDLPNNLPGFLFTKLPPDFQEKFDHFKKNIIPFTAFAIATLPLHLPVVRTILPSNNPLENYSKFKKCIQGETPRSIAGKAPDFQYSVDIDADGELVTSLKKNGQSLTPEEAPYERYYDAALVGWLKSQGYEFVPKLPEAAGPSGVFESAGVALTKADLDNLNAPGSGLSLQIFIEEKLGVHMTEEAAPPAPRP